MVAHIIAKPFCLLLRYVDLCLFTDSFQNWFVCTPKTQFGKAVLGIVMPSISHFRDYFFTKRVRLMICSCNSKQPQGE
jgi:hypothetical protein